MKVEGDIYWEDMIEESGLKDKKDGEKICKLSKLKLKE